MASTFASLRQDFLSRGFDYWNNDATWIARTKELFNASYLELCDEENWPFLEIESATYSPATFSFPTFPGLKTVRYVVDLDNTVNGTLVGADESVLVDVYGDLLTAGSPQFYYVSNLTGSNPTVRVYPLGGSIRVHYYKLPAELVNDADEPLIPQRFRRYIVEGMVRVAAQEDAPEASKAAEAERQRGIDLMRRSLLFQSGSPSYMGLYDESLDS